MTGRCPECGQPPRYHSWCTLCARLFRRSAKHWTVRARQIVFNSRLKELHAARKTRQEAAAQLGCCLRTLDIRRQALGLPPFYSGW